MELLGNDPGALKWLAAVAAAAAEPVSGRREVEEHYWSQLSKGEIRRLHDKYKVDHELFGFEPDYYIAMGQEEDTRDESDNK